MAPGAEEFLLKAAEGEEGPEGVTHGVHAQTACNPQRHAQAPTVPNGRLAMSSTQLVRGGLGWIPALVFTGAGSVRE